jgi:hypothetical protein
VSFRKITMVAAAVLVAAAGAVAAIRRDGPSAVHPESPAQTGPSAPNRRDGQPWWKKYRSSLILGLLGLVVLPVGFVIYPSVAELPTPGYSQLVIHSDTQIGFIQYGVSQISDTSAEITVRIGLTPGAADGTATLTLLLPFGATFINCAPPDCHGNTPAGDYWSKKLILKAGGDPLLAIPHIFVKTSNFGEISNGVTASAVIPEVTYNGPSTPEPALLAGYKILSGRSYDWSSFEPQSFTDGFVVWAEDFSAGDTQSRVAIGTNHDAQDDDDFMIFLAGAVVALAGAAILAAVQEALHAGEKDS